MPRIYKTKQGSKKRMLIDKNKLKTAVYDVIFSGKSLRGVAKEYDISVMTLKRYVKKKKEAITSGGLSPTYEPDYKQAQVFNQNEESNLSDYLETASKLYHGLTPKAARLLAFQFAVENKKNMPENWKKNEIASYDWLHGFMRRHANLSLRVPEATSLSRATSFNKHNVSKFFQNLQSLYTRFNFEPQDIWNLDETGITTVHKPKKIIACKGLKQVSKVVSAERGELVTLCCAISAAGVCTPPFLIFPRKNWQNRMIDNGPPGTNGAAYPSGWMTSVNFVLFLKHFKKHVRCSKDNPCLIVMDNHESHISIDSVNFARENGIHLLTIPPHTSQKLQPLDRILFGTLKSYYNTACDDWMLAHPGRPLTIYDICGCIGKAYPLAMTPRNIVKSFEITGIYPFNSEIFNDDDFLSSYVTDRPEDCNPDPVVQTVTHENNIVNLSQAMDESDNDITDAEDIVQDSTLAERISSPRILESFDMAFELTHLDQNVLLSVAQSPSSPFVIENTPKTDFPSGDSPACAIQAQKLSLNQQTTAETINSVNASVLHSTPLNVVEKLSFNIPANETYVNDNTVIVAQNKTVTDLQVPSTSKYVSPEIIRPHPKAGPRKSNSKGRKKGATRIITDTPEKNEIEEEARRKEEKNRKNSAKGAKRNFEVVTSKFLSSKQQKSKKATKVKRQKRHFRDSLSSEEDVTLPPSPESDYLIEDETEEHSEEEEEVVNDLEEDNVHEGDWVVVNFVSERSIPHRYVGQVVNESLASLDIKFAKKIDDKRFKWPQNPDSSVIGKYQVVKKLPPPIFKSTSKRVGVFQFPKSLRQFKIKK